MTNSDTSADLIERRKAYVNMLAGLDFGLEVITDSGPEYVVASDGELWWCESGGEPETIGTTKMEELLNREKVYVVDREELYEMSEVYQVGF